MAKQSIPPTDELEQYYAPLVAQALGRYVDAKLEVILEPFPIDAFITKTKIFGANVRLKNAEETGSIPIPSPIVVKKYLPNIQRTSEDGDPSREEFRRERTVLAMGERLSLNGFGTYPEIYSVDSDDCTDEMIIVREFVKEDNLKQIAESQKRERKIKWEAAKGTVAISDSLEPITLLHVKSRSVAQELREKGLLRFDLPPKNVTNLPLAYGARISGSRAHRFSRYVQKTVREMGTEAEPADLLELSQCISYLDGLVISTPPFLVTVDGELDVFPHHAMPTRLLDAGGVEVGGFVRDLALYSSPIFNSVWKSPEDMAARVREAYLNVRADLEDRLQYGQSKFDNENVELGILLASAMGNFRTAAAILNYGADDLEEEHKDAYIHARNGLRYFSAFANGITKNPQSKRKAKRVYNILEEIIPNIRYDSQNPGSFKKLGGIIERILTPQSQIPDLRLESPEETHTGKQ